EGRPTDGVGRRVGQVTTSMPMTSPGCTVPMIVSLNGPLEPSFQVATSVIFAVAPTAGGGLPRATWKVIPEVTLRGRTSGAAELAARVATPEMSIWSAAESTPMTV